MAVQTTKTKTSTLKQGDRAFIVFPAQEIKRYPVKFRRLYAVPVEVLVLEPQDKHGLLRVSSPIQSRVMGTSAEYPIDSKFIRPSAPRGTAQDAEMMTEEDIAMAELALFRSQAQS